MEQPSFIAAFADWIGKPVSEFTPDDWKNAALNAASILDEIKPPPKKRGAPRKRPVNALADFRRWRASPVRKRGRPTQRYGKDGIPIGVIADLLDESLTMSWPSHWQGKKPKTQSDAMRRILKAIGAFPGTASSVLRAVRRYNADKNRQ